MAGFRDFLQVDLVGMIRKAHEGVEEGDDGDCSTMTSNLKNGQYHRLTTIRPHVHARGARTWV